MWKVRKADVSSGNTCYSMPLKGRHYTPTHRVRDLLKEFGSMACMSPVLEKANLIGEAPGQRPGDVYFPNMYNGEAARRILQ